MYPQQSLTKAQHIMECFRADWKALWYKCTLHCHPAHKKIYSYLQLHSLPKIVHLKWDADFSVTALGIVSPSLSKLCLVSAKETSLHCVSVLEEKITVEANKSYLWLHKHCQAGTI